MASEADLEEGEICSDGECSDEAPCKESNKGIEAYNVIERPEASKYAGGQRYRNTAAEDIRYSSDEEDEGAVSSDEDSPVKKIRTKNVFKPPISTVNQGPYKQDKNWVADTHKTIIQGSTRGKKPNNIWGSVLQEETMTKFVNQLNRNENISYTERGAESYDYTRSKLDPRFKKGKDAGKSESESESSSESDSEEEESGPADLTAKETFGFVVDKKSKKPSVKSRLGIKSEGVEDGDSSESGEGDEDTMEVNQGEKAPDARKKLNKNSKHKSRRSKERDNDSMDVNNDEGDNKKKDVKDRLGSKNRSEKNSSSGGGFDLRDKVNSRKRRRNKGREDRKGETEGGVRPHPSRMHKFEQDNNLEVKPMKMSVAVPADMDEVALADTMIDALREPEDKMELFLRIIETLGAEKTVQLFKATEDVESMGGLMIQNGIRRRTPGGVFLYMIRNDADISQEQLDEVFAEQRQEYRAQCKKWKKDQKHWRKQERAGENHIEEGGGMDTSDVGASGDTPTKQVTPEKTESSRPNKIEQMESEKNLVEEQLKDVEEEEIFGEEADDAANIELM